MKKLLLSLLVLSSLLVGCAKEEEDSASLSSSSSELASCLASDNSSCTSYAGMSQAYCSGGTIQSGVCPSTLGSNLKVGTCSGTESGINFENVYYTADGSDPYTFYETACNSSGYTWVAALALTQSLDVNFYCEYQDKCVRLEKVSLENAENFCNHVNGYLVDSCQ